MTDPVESELRATLRARADSVTVPPPPQELLRSPRPAPRRRSGWVVAAVSTAAVVVGVVAATTFLGSPGRDGDGTPDPAGTVPPASAGPTGAPSPTDDLGVPFIEDGVFRTGSESLPTTADRLQVAGGTALLTDTYYGGGRETSRSFLRTGGRLVALDELAASIPVLGPDGRRVAALTFEGGGTRITTYEVGDGLTVLDRLDLPAPGSCCDGNQVSLLGLDDTGRVYFDDDGTSYVWDGGTTATPVTGAPGRLVDVGSFGVVAEQGEPGSAERKVVGDVSPAGTFEARATIPTADPTEPLVWSPDGRSVAHTGSAGPVVDVLDDGAPAEPLDVGDRVFSGVVAVEDDTTVLLVARTGSRSDLLRCVPGAPCTVVRDLGWPASLGDLVLPG